MEWEGMEADMVGRDGGGYGKGWRWTWGGMEVDMGRDGGGYGEGSERAGNQIHSQGSGCSPGLVEKMAETLPPYIDRLYTVLVLFRKT